MTQGRVSEATFSLELKWRLDLTELPGRQYALGRPAQPQPHRANLFLACGLTEWGAGSSETQPVSLSRPFLQFSK